MFRKKNSEDRCLPWYLIKQILTNPGRVTKKKSNILEKSPLPILLSVGKKASQNSIQKKDDKVGKKSGYKRKGKGKEESKKKFRNRLAKKIQILFYTQARRTKTLHNFIQIAGHCTLRGRTI